MTGGTSIPGHFVTCEPLTLRNGASAVRYGIRLAELAVELLGPL